MPRKRGDRIGRAAHGAEHVTSFDDLMRGAKDGWTRIALAAVAEAREIDRCETCKHRQGGLQCDLFEIMTYQIDNCGCNRHEPKGE